MNMTATVIRVNPQSLLVRNEATGEEVLVLFRNARNFSVGERVSINFNGQMTASIPPQISANSIQRLGQIPQPPSFMPTPSEMRGTITQRGRNFLMVRDNNTRQQFRVDFAQAHHFCVRQQVLVRYDTITFGNPPRVTATDVLPVC